MTMLHPNQIRLGLNVTVLLRLARSSWHDGI
jgi:hypothetical protein